MRKLSELMSRFHYFYIPFACLAINVTCVRLPLAFQSFEARLALHPDVHCHISSKATTFIFIDAAALYIHDQLNLNICYCPKATNSPPVLTLDPQNGNTNTPTPNEPTALGHEETHPTHQPNNNNTRPSLLPCPPQRPLTRNLPPRRRPNPTNKLQPTTTTSEQHRRWQRQQNPPQCPDAYSPQPEFHGDERVVLVAERGSWVVERHALGAGVGFGRKRNG